MCTCSKMVNKYIEEIKVYLKRSNPEDKDDVKWYYIVPSVSLAIVILIVIVLIAKRYICKYLPFRISIVMLLLESYLCGGI